MDSATFEKINNSLSGEERALFDRFVDPNVSAGERLAIISKIVVELTLRSTSPIELRRDVMLDFLLYHTQELTTMHSLGLAQENVQVPATDARRAIMWVNSRVTHLNQLINKTLNLEQNVTVDADIRTLEKSLSSIGAENNRAKRQFTNVSNKLLDENLRAAFEALRRLVMRRT